MTPPPLHRRAPRPRDPRHSAGDCRAPDRRRRRAGGPHHASAGGRQKLQLPAIYRAFSNKQALLDERVEAIPAKALPDGRESDREAEVALLARQLRQALPAQREGARIVGGGCAAKRHSLTPAERLVGVMRRAGFNGVAALWATSTVFCYVLGEALEQQCLTDDARDRLTLPGGSQTYPQPFSTPVEKLLDFDDRFEFGLRLVLGGLRGQLAQ